MPAADTTPDEVDAIVRAAARARWALRTRTPEDRAALMGALAEAIEERAGELVAAAEAESHLDGTRLRGEVARTAFQFRILVDELRSGVLADAVIDHADDTWPPGPRPDIRRVLVPAGPVLIFEASNFPFAFGVAGTDTAAALAAGCPVIVKVHPAHPVLAELLGDLLSRTLAGQGYPDGAFALIFGTEAGRVALAHPDLAAGAFTGSAVAGRALHDVASSRAKPIPFYAEMGSVNPVFVTARAMRARSAAIWSGFVASFTGSAGQLCTKPGVIAVPREHADDAARDAAVATTPARRLLTRTIAASFGDGLHVLKNRPGTRTLAQGSGECAPVLVRVGIDDVLAVPARYLTEHFGPASVVVAYDDEKQLLDLAERLDGQLTATVHCEPGDAIVAPLVERLEPRVGRLLFNGWPTGVSVTHAMHHGGPYPATTGDHTSVGPGAVRRFLRPVAYQNAPDGLLPPELHETNPLGLTRRVDGGAYVASRPEEAR